MSKLKEQVGGGLRLSEQRQKELVENLLHPEEYREGRLVKIINVLRDIFIKNYHSRVGRRLNSAEFVGFMMDDDTVKLGIGYLGPVFKAIDSEGEKLFRFDPSPDSVSADAYCQFERCGGDRVRKTDAEGMGKIGAWKVIDVQSKNTEIRYNMKNVMEILDYGIKVKHLYLLMFGQVGNGIDELRRFEKKQKSISCLIWERMGRLVEKRKSDLPAYTLTDAGKGAMSLRFHEPFDPDDI